MRMNFGSPYGYGLLWLASDSIPLGVYNMYMLYE